jgi:hypothetical protein
MKRLVIIAAAAVSLTAGCGTTGSDLEITITAPPGQGASADESYIVEWTLDTEGWADASVNIYVDTDTDPSSGLVLIAESLGVDQTGFNWECAGFPAGEYWVRGVIREGGYQESDYSDGVLTVSHTSATPPENVWIDEALSQGDTVVVSWSSVSSAESYTVEYDADSSGSWVTLIAEADTTSLTHLAPSAGLYAVRTNDSEGQSERSEPASTMPSFGAGTFTIWEEGVPEGDPVAIYFNPCDPNFVYGYSQGGYHIYCHSSVLEPAALFSGDAPPEGGGLEAPLADGAATPSLAPQSPGVYEDSLAVDAGSVAFLQIPLGRYIKLLVRDIPSHPDAPSVSGVSFDYEYQEIDGLRLFTGRL